ncbi:MAG: hypothetical protein DIU80_010230 [Chloroflexota bacterium]
MSKMTDGMPDAYFDIERLDDGRFCVQLVGRNSPTRKSYAPHLAAVIGQMVRARLPVRTQDEELQRICRDRELELLA